MPGAKNPPKTPCKNSPKTPQKSFITNQKSFMTLPIADRKKFFSILNSARKQKMDTNYCMMNLALFSSMFPELKQKLSGPEDEIIIDGVKIQLSIYSKPDMIYFKGEPFDIAYIEASYKFNQANKSF